MPVNVYDQAARYTKKLNPPGFFHWLFRAPQPPLLFREWLDTRTLPFPGERDRTCDTVAAFDDPAQPGELVALIAESQSEPDPDMPERGLEYLARFRRELRHGADRKKKYAVGLVLLNLTGPAQQDTLHMVVPGQVGGELRFQVIQRTLRDEDAAATLAAIARGDVALCILPWIPLMRGGGEASIIEEWKRCAGAEPEQRRRSDYAGLALVFAELARVREEWRSRLEGWNVLQSQQVLEWQAQARAEGVAQGVAQGAAEARAEILLEARRGNVLRLFQLRFPPLVPADVANAVQTMTDLDQLARWFDAAATATSLEAFRAAIQQPAPNGAK